jgi:hypothetical protein
MNEYERLIQEIKDYDNYFFDKRRELTDIEAHRIADRCIREFIEYQLNGSMLTQYLYEERQKEEDDLSMKLLDHIIKYESDTFSASGWEIDRKKAEMILSYMIQEVMGVWLEGDLTKTYMDGVKLATVCEELFEPEEKPS